MFSTFRERFGVPGVIAVIALVFAMAGGAFAASGGLSGKQKKEVKKIAQTEAKKLAGTGPAGPQGPPGSPGAAGKDGTPGAPGKDGTSVTSEEFVGTKDGKCVGVGGSKFIAASGNTYACNGKAGKDGETGFTETLPPGKTETGAWIVPGEAETAVPISFNIPLPNDLKGTEYLKPTETAAGTTNCPGIKDGVATAAEGYLCLYQTEGGVLDFFGPPGATTSRNGAALFAVKSTGGLAYGFWAVTAE